MRRANDGGYRSSDHQFVNTELTTFLNKDVLYLFQMQTPDGEINTWDTL